MSVILGLATAVAIVGLLSRHRPLAPRLPAPRHETVTPSHDHPARRAAHRSRVSLPIALAVVMAVALFAVDPRLSVALLGAMSAVVVIRRRATAARHRRAVRDELPTAVELLRLALSAGLTLAAAVEVVAPDLEGPIGRRFRWIVRQVGTGAPLSGALEEVGIRDGPPLQPVCSMLASSVGSGAPVADALHLIAVRLRGERRRDLQTKARRLPVTLLFPVIVCVLPAFGLLTVVPLIGGGLSSLGQPLGP